MKRGSQRIKQRPKPLTISMRGRELGHGTWLRARRRRAVISHFVASYAEQYQNENNRESRIEDEDAAGRSLNESTRLSEGGLSQTREVIGSDRDGVIFALLRRNKKNEDWRPKTKDPNDESADENEDKKKIESELETKADTHEDHHAKQVKPSNKSESNIRIALTRKGRKRRREPGTTPTAPSIATDHDDEEEEEET